MRVDEAELPTAGDLGVNGRSRGFTSGSSADGRRLV